MAAGESNIALVTTSDETKRITALAEMRFVLSLIQAITSGPIGPEVRNTKRPTGETMACH